MKRTIMLYAALFCALGLHAQVKIVSSQQTGQPALDAVKQGPGLYSVMVRFPADSGSVRIYTDTVSVSRRFLALSRQDAGRRYAVSVELGNAWGEVDASAMYRVPVAGHKSAVYRLAIDRGWVTHVFGVEQGDTLYAVRKGVIVSARKAEDRKSEEMVVQHIDGSWASYRGLAPGSLLVKPGQTVWADTPVARAGKNRKYGWSMLLSVKSPTVVTGKKGRSELALADVEPLFAVASSEALPGKCYRFVPRISYELLTQDMTPEDLERMRKALEAGAE